MCFTATASFGSAALLLPLGAASTVIARRSGRDHLLPLALCPLFFGLQQGLEGVVWLGLAGGRFEPLLHPVALGYLFFAYAFWPIWIPWAALHFAGRRLSAERVILLRLVQPLGLMFGLLLWLPLLIDPQVVTPELVGGSLVYTADVPYATWGVGSYGKAIYAGIISLPLLLSPSARIAAFGCSLLLAFGLADWVYHQAFSSVWCYFSAVLSSMIVWIVRTEPLGAEPSPDGITL
jgi:hypothetical protein